MMPKTVSIACHPGCRRGTDVSAQKATEESLIFAVAPPTQESCGFSPLNSNILNNKRSLSSFSVQILSIFTFSRRKRDLFSHNPRCKEAVFSHFPHRFRF